jgi:hypothetical protein
MSYLDNYRARLEASGTVSDTSELMLDNIRNQFEIMPGYFLVQVLLPDGSIEDRRVQSLRSKTDELVLFHPDEVIEEGYVILGLKDRDWLVTFIDWTGDILKKGKLVQLNFELKWTDAEVGDVITQKAYVGTVSRRASNFEETAFFTLPVGQREVILQANDFTERLVLGRRLAINKRYFEVTDVDVFTYANCVVLRMEEDLKSQNDSDEVADIGDFEEFDGQFKVTGPDYITKGTSEYYTLTKDGVEYTANVTWGFTTTPQGITIQNLNGILKVTASEDLDFLGASTTFYALYSSSKYNKTVTIKSLV